MPRIFGGKEARTAFKKGKPDLAAENTVCYLQVLGLGTDCNDSTPAVLLFFDRQRYLFNAGEGFQRFCVEHKVKMNRVSSCLVTRLTGDATGGLPGMCLTMADASSAGPSNRPKLDIVGPVGLAALVNAMRSFISSNAVGINALEFGGSSLPTLAPFNPPLGKQNGKLQRQITDRPLASSAGRQAVLPDRTAPCASTATVAGTGGYASSNAAQDSASMERENIPDGMKGDASMGGVAIKMEPSSSKVGHGAGAGEDSPTSQQWEGPPVYMGAGAGLRAPNGTKVPPGATLSPVVENDLVTITPVLLRSNPTPTAEGEKEDPQSAALAAARNNVSLHNTEAATGNGVSCTWTANESAQKAGGGAEQMAVDEVSMSGANKTAQESKRGVEQMEVVDMGGREAHESTQNLGSSAEQVASRVNGPEASCVAVKGSLGAVAADGEGEIDGADSSEHRPPKRPRKEAPARSESAHVDTATPGALANDSVHTIGGASAAAADRTGGVDCAVTPLQPTLVRPTPQTAALPPLVRPMLPPPPALPIPEPASGPSPARMPQSGVSPFDPPGRPAGACYICELTKVPGRFLPDVAMSLGVPRGIMFATLKSGKSVTLEDGRVVEAYQVNEPHHPGPVAVIADCSDPSYLPSLLAAPEWERFYQLGSGDVAEQSGQERKAVDVMAHLARAEIVERSDYQSWLARFGPNTRHIFVNSHATKAAPIMTSSALIQARLNCLHPTIFPLHQYAPRAKPEAPSPAFSSVPSPSCSTILRGGSSSPNPCSGEGEQPDGNHEISPMPVLVTSDSVKKEAVPVPERHRELGSRRARSLHRDFVQSGDTPIYPAQENGKIASSSSHGMNGVTPPIDNESMQEGCPEAPYRRLRNAPRVKAFKLDERCVAGQNLLKFHLRPPSRRGCFDDGEVPAALDLAAVPEEMAARTDLMEVLKTTLEMGEAVNTGRGHSRECDEAGNSQDGGGPLEGHAGLVQQLGKEALEIVFLGTGAAIPSKYRNVTGIYLDFFRRGGMMMDCGEGSYGQLRRKFGDNSDEVLKGLRCIWISHIHADHHAGLPRVLSRRRQLLGADCPPLLVIGPRALHRALYAHGQCEPLAYHFIDCSVTVPRHPGPREEKDKAIFAAAKEALGLSKIESITVDHCANSYGGVLESVDGWKLVFSGDTRPCMNVVQAAKNATVLIHEATFEDALEAEAVSKKHSLTCEAVEVGAKARVYRTILTHFSQRYPKIPVIDPSFQTSTCIASDLMTVNLADLPLLPWLVKPLGMLFHGTTAEMEEDEEEAAAEPATTNDAQPSQLKALPISA